jgi:hypothetical protein
MVCFTINRAIFEDITRSLKKKIKKKKTPEPGGAPAGAAPFDGPHSPHIS